MPEGIMQTSGKQILYVGGFVLPDRNAAAHRVISNAKILRELGYDVVFLNYSDDISAPRITTYFGFSCFECPSSEWGGAGRVDIDRIKEVAAKLHDLHAVIAYNYPALPLARLAKLCRKHGILCIGDVTEWYRARDAALIKMPLKFIDTALRMRVLNKRLDGLIVISRFLEHYYKPFLPIVLLPPLVDINDEKWAEGERREHSGVKLVYAGSPSKTKERLDIIVKAVQSQDSCVNATLDVVGITREEYSSIYDSAPGGRQTRFWGRISHEKALAIVKDADYSVIIRDDNRVTRAGFPTKFAESVSCGTAVICNDNSDLAEWVNRLGCGLLTSEEELPEAIKMASECRCRVSDRDAFDFRSYIKPMGIFMKEIENKGKESVRG